MRNIEIVARSVNEAVNQALEELNLSIEDVDLEIIEEPSKGFLGIIGSKQAKIRVTEKDDPIRYAKKFVQDVVSKMGILTDVIVDENREFTKMTLTGKNMGILIGRRGETLDALQYLVNLVANKNIRYDRKKIIIDAEGYRERREETLVRLAHRLAERVRRTGIRVVLEPMNPQERRIIHTTLQDDIYVQTYSEGEDPFRKIVISLR